MFSMVGEACQSALLHFILIEDYIPNFLQKIDSINFYLLIFWNLYKFIVFIQFKIAYLPII